MSSTRARPVTRNTSTSTSDSVMTSGGSVCGPSISVEAILAGRQPRILQLADLLEDVPVDWGEQQEGFFISAL